MSRRPHGTLRTLLLVAVGGFAGATLRYAVSLLAPAAELPAGLNAADALKDVTAPLQVVYATRDSTADWEPVVAAARELDCEVVELAADHFFIGRFDAVADAAGPFLADACR